MRTSILKHTLLLCGLSAAWATTSLAAPGDITTVVAPPSDIPSTAPKGGDQNDLVSSSGEASYRIPVDVPPGRNGAAPSLALVYGSRSPLRGGVAAGWTLPLGEISVDTSAGWAAGIGYAVGGQRLMRVDEPQRFADVTTYRLHGDTSYARYEHVADGTEPGFWRVRHLDGSITEYGSTPDSRDERTDGLPGGMFGGQGRWMVSRTVDARGNEVVYNYEPVLGFAHDDDHTDLSKRKTVDIRIKSISYGRNLNVASSTHHAGVNFDYASDLETCFDANVPVGAQFSFRTGIRRYEGASKLLAIRGVVKSGLTWVTRTKLELTYDTAAATCGLAHAPLRVLSSVKRIAWNQDGVMVEMPPTTMTYGPMDFAFESTGSTQGRVYAEGTSARNVATNGFPTTFGATADVDGDGIQDEVTFGTGPGCGPGIGLPGASYPWADNAAQPADGPNVPLYKRETCASTMQIVHRSKDAGHPLAWEGARQINNFRMLDVTGDGLPDLVTQLSYNADGYDPAKDPAMNGPTANTGTTAYPACADADHPVPPPPCKDGNYAMGCVIDWPQFQPLGRDTWTRDDHPAPNPPVIPLNEPTWRSNNTGSGGSAGSGTEGSGCSADAQPSNCFAPPCPCVGIEGSHSSPAASDDPEPGRGLADVVEAGAQAKFVGGARAMTVGTPIGDTAPHGLSKFAMIPDMHCGRYVVRVYKNLGPTATDGCLAPSGIRYACKPDIVYSPIPMEAVGYASRADGGPLANASTWTAFSDIDGDGYLDAIWQYPSFAGGGVFEMGGNPIPSDYLVWRGGPGGQFLGRPGGGEYRWPIGQAHGGGRLGINARDAGEYRNAAGFPINTGALPGQADSDPKLSNRHQQSQSMSTLQDINGDGLPDLVFSDSVRSVGHAYVYFNTGNGFDTTPTSLDAKGALLAAGAPQAETTSRTITVPFLVSAAGDLDEAYTVTTRRMVDLDGDGLQDITSMPVPLSGGSRNGTTVPGQRTPITAGDVWVHVNLGDKMVPAKLSLDATRNWYHSLSAITAHRVGMVWSTTTDVRDDDGDGLPETQVVTPTPSTCTYPDFDCSQNAEGRRAQRLPYRLLTNIDNGLGVSTKFTYASVRDGTVVTRTDGPGPAVHRVAAPVSVVKQVDVTTNVVAGVASTKYSYKNPVTNLDDFGRVGFRGFEEVRTTTPEPDPGVFATHVRRYDFTVDKLGRPVRELTYSQANLVSMVDTSYVETTTFNDAVRAVQVAETRTYTCTPSSAASAETTCLSAPVQRSTTRWSWLNAASATASTQAGNDTAPEQPATTGETGAGGAGGTGGATGAGSNCQIMLCGSNTGSSSANVSPILAWVPVSHQRSAAPTGKHVGDRLDTTTYGFRYEAGKYMTLVIGEQSVEAVTEGTFAGARTLANSATTYDAADRGLPVSSRKEMDPGTFGITKRTYDGYGNVTSITRPTQMVGTKLAKTLTYDVAFNLYPVTETDELGLTVGHSWDIGLGKVTEELAPKQGTLTPWTRTKYDGFGRVLQLSRSKLSGSSLVDLVTLVASYSDTLANHSVSQQTTLDEAAPLGKKVKAILDGQGRVVEEYHYTSPTTYERTLRRYNPAGNLYRVYVPNPLGAAPEHQVYTTSFDGLGRVRRVDAPGRAPRFQVYNGLVTTITEVPTDASMPSTKVLENDALGRLVRVTEGTTNPVTTTYAYDAMDRMTQIVDADNVGTAITYTLGGLRYSVTRAGHELWYQYDVEGNRIAAHHPTPSGTPRDAVDYVSTWSYDAVGRVKTSMPAIRDQQPNRTRYKIGSTVYWYGDSDRAFGAGRLTRVVTNYGTTTYDYTVEGNVATETRSLFVAPDGVTMISNGTTKLTYNVAGQPVTITHPDDPTAPTQTRYSYDALGRPAKAEVLGSGGAWQPLAAFARNNAGLVASRYSASPSTVEQSFTYDAAGRIIAHEINGIKTAGSAVTVLGGEGLVYAQDGNVQSVTDRATNRQLAYKYDDRQQLVSAFVPNTNDYQATFAYSPAGKVTGASILSTLAGTQVVSRNVAYEFAGAGDPTDPAAPRRLVTPTGSVFAAMTYDASGNVRQRTANGVTTSFTYDGEDAQREAINVTTGEREVYFYDHKGERIMTYRPARNGQPATLVNRIGTTEITTDTTGARSTVTDVVLGAHPVARVINHAAATPQKLYHGVLGSLLVTTDASRVMRARYGYGPYGEVLYTEGPDAAVFDRTYEDKARDKMTGLSYFGARYYDPLTLGWTQADPLYRFVPDMAYTEPRRMGLYTYSMNNPLRYVDPDGLDGDEKDKDKDKEKACSPTPTSHGSAAPPREYNPDISRVHMNEPRKALASLWKQFERMIKQGKISKTEAVIAYGKVIAAYKSQAHSIKQPENPSHLFTSVYFTKTFPAQLLPSSISATENNGEAHGKETAFEKHFEFEFTGTASFFEMFGGGTANRNGGGQTTNYTQENNSGTAIGATASTPSVWQIGVGTLAGTVDVKSTSGKTIPMAVRLGPLDMEIRTNRLSRNRRPSSGAGAREREWSGPGQSPPYAMTSTDRAPPAFPPRT